LNSKKKLRVVCWESFNPDFAVGIVMKGKKAIKTGGWAVILDESIMNYVGIKKSIKRLFLQNFFL